MPVSSNCRIIVIEGPDKVGKQTQTAMLVESLRGLGVKVATAEIPYNDGPIYNRIYEWLRNGVALKYPEAFQTYQVANRLVWQGDVLPKLAQNNDVIIMDRWNISAIVYGRGSGLSEEQVQDIIVNSGLVEPDLVFVFDGEPFITPDREDDSYERNMELRRKVREGYMRWADENSDIALKVPANRPREDVANDLLNHAKMLLNL